MQNWRKFEHAGLNKTQNSSYSLLKCYAIQNARWGCYFEDEDEDEANVARKIKHIRNDFQ
jgi:hypothetical protein